MSNLRSCYLCRDRASIDCRKCGRGYCKACYDEHLVRETFEAARYDERTGKRLEVVATEHPSVCEAVPK